MSPSWMLQRAMAVGRQAVQHGHGLALRAGGHDDDLLGRQPVDLVQADQHVVGDVEIAQLAGHLGVFDHAPAGDGDLALVSLGHIHHLLDARDQRRKGGDDQPARRFAHDLVKGIVQHRLRRGRAGLVGVGAVREQRQHAPLAELGQLGLVGGPAIHRGVIELEIAAVDDQARRRRDAQPHRIGDGVADVIGLDGKRADVDHVAGGVGVQRRSAPACRSRLSLTSIKPRVRRVAYTGTSNSSKK